MGRIEQSVGQGPDQPFIINIRDAHRKLDSQYSIDRLLTRLTDQYDLGLVAMEGASGAVHTGLLAAFPDRDDRRALADNLLRRGEFSASEYFAVTSDRSVRLFGAESAGLYQANRNLFEAVLSLASVARAMSKRLQARYDREAARRLSPEALEFRTARDRFRLKEIPLDAYVAVLSGLERRSGLRGADARKGLGHFSLYLRVLRAEKRLDLDRADAERKAILRGIRTAQPGISPNLARLTTDLAEKKIDQTQFYRSLWRIARAVDVDLTAYPALRAYLRYLNQVGRLDLWGVGTDLAALERRMERVLGPTAEEQEYFQRDRRRLLVTKLALLQLSSEEYRELRRDPDLRRARLALEADARGSRAAAELRTLRTALAFYAVAERRNRHLLANTLKKMKREGIRAAALVTGGFHTEGLTELMTAGRVSHLVVMPAYDPEAGDRPYVTVLTRKPAEWERRLAGDDLFLAAPAWLEKLPSTPEAAEQIVAMILAVRRHRGQADLSLAALDQYVTNYARLRRMDPSANPFPTARLRKILSNPIPVRRASPGQAKVSMMEVMIGRNTWRVAVTQQGAPVAAQRLSEQAVPVHVEYSSPRVHPALAVNPLQGPSTLDRLVEAYRDYPHRGNPGAAERWFDENAPGFVRRTTGRVSRDELNGLRGPFLAATSLVGVARMASAEQGRTALEGSGQPSGVTPAVRLAAPAAKKFRPVDPGLMPDSGSLPLTDGHVPADWNELTAMFAAASGGMLDGPVVAEPVKARPRVLTFGGLMTLALWTGFGILLTGSAGVLAVSAVYLAAAMLFPDQVTQAASTAMGQLNCGPVLVSRKRTPGFKGFISKETRARLRTEVRQASKRGGQAVGVFVIVQKKGVPHVLFEKAVKSNPRKSIVKVFDRTLDALIARAKREGYKPMDDSETFFVHLRYATGGSTNWDNTHPHWHNDPAKKEVWSVAKRENGQTVIGRAIRVVFNLIAHNGDIYRVKLRFWNKAKAEWEERWIPYDQARVYYRVGMPNSRSFADLDSKSIAEFIDWNLTAGQVDASVRYAFYTTAVDTEEVLGAYVPRRRREKFAAYAKRLDASVRARIKAGRIPPGIPTAVLTGIQNAVSDILTRAELPPGFEAGLIRNTPAQVKDDVRAAVERMMRAQLGNDAQAKAFAENFTRAFFEQNLEWTMNEARRELDGTFALKVITTMEKRFGLYAYNQTLSLGKDPVKSEILASAEPGGVTNALGGVKGAHQIFLENGAFALVDWPNGHHANIDERIGVYPAEDPGRPGVPAPLTVAELPWFPIENDKIEADTPGQKELSPTEEIERNLRAIPGVLKRIDNSFHPGDGKVDPIEHMNANTMDFLAECIGDLAVDYQRRTRAAGERSVSGRADLVLFGVDHNLGSLMHFVETLKKFFPDLNVVVLDSQEAMMMFREASNEVRAGREPTRVGPKTVVMGFSNSAQTSSSLGAVHLAKEFKDLMGAKSWKDRRIFIETQRLFNAMSQVLGQGYQRSDPVLPVTFSNRSHKEPDGSNVTRYNEAATVEVAATHAVLTEILAGLVEKVALPMGRAAFNAPALKSVDIQAIRDFKKVSNEEEAPDRVGWDVHGRKVREESDDIPGYHNLEREAKVRAHNVAEYLKAYIPFALYVIISGGTGVGIFSWLTSPNILPAAYQLPTEYHWVAGALGGVFALFLPWLLHLVIRGITGRPLWDRMIGTRVQVFVDSSANARILFRYHKTLFANAPGFASANFYAADYLRNILHEFGVDAHRGAQVMVRYFDDLLSAGEAERAQAASKVKAQVGGIEYHGGKPQIVEKVRAGSGFVQEGRPSPHQRQVILSDRMEGLRSKYAGQLHPAIQEFIARRNEDLTDGILAEMTIGYLQARRISELRSAPFRLLFGRRLGMWIARKLGMDLLWELGTTFNEAKIHSTTDGITEEGPSVGDNTMRARAPEPEARMEAEFKPEPEAPAAVLPVLVPPTPTPASPPPVVAAAPAVAKPSASPSAQDLGITVQFTLNAAKLFINLPASVHAPAGEKILLEFSKTDGNRHSGSDPRGVRWTMDREVDPANASQQRLIFRSAGVAQFHYQPMPWVIEAVKKLQGARLSQTPAAFRASYVVGRPRIGVVLSETVDRAEWMQAWGRWTGRAASPDEFIFGTAAGDDRAAEIDRLRRAGAWWVVDATEGIGGSMPEWILALQNADAGSSDLLRSLIGKMTHAPSTDLWTAGDWARLTDLAERSVPRASAARLVVDSGALVRMHSAPASGAEPSEIRAMIADLDKRLADAILEPALLKDPAQRKSLTAAWADFLLLNGRAGNTPSQMSATSATAYRTAFAAADPSHQAAPSIGDSGLIVTDLDIFVRDGRVPYQMRMERLQRLSGGALRSALRVNDPTIRTREELLKRYPEAEVFDHLLFTGAGETTVAADLIREATGAWGLTGAPVVHITARPMVSAAPQTSTGSFWTVALDPSAETTIGLLEAGANLLIDPTRSVPGLRSIPGSRIFIYKWPKAVSVDYRRLVESLRAARMSA